MASSRPILSLRTSSNETKSSSLATNGSGNGNDSEGGRTPLATHRPTLASPIGFVSSPISTPHAFPLSADSRQGLQSAFGSTGAGAGTGAGTGTNAASNRIFSQLDQINALQKQIAETHARFEGLDASSISPTAPGDLEGLVPPKVQEANPHQLDPGEEPASKADYDKMRTNFDNKRGDIDMLMSKLGDLSSALKAFHALPSPVVFPSTTHDTPVSAAVFGFRRDGATPPTDKKDDKRSAPVGGGGGGPPTSTTRRKGARTALGDPTSPASSERWKVKERQLSYS